jgi:DNA-binding transcriptional LysR family regulator
LSLRWSDILTLPRISLRKVACFVATAEAGSVSLAAQRLNLSQASLSETLIDLERELGVDLFIRHKARGVTLTSAAQQLLPEARQLVRHAEDFQALVHGSGSALAGELVLGCFPTILPFVMPKLLQGFQAEHPEVHIRFVEDTQLNLERSMLDGTLDLSVLYDIDLGPSIERRPLFYCVPYILLAPDHRLAKSNEPVDLHDLVDDPLIQIDVQPGRNDHVFGSVGLAPRIAHRTTNFELVRALVARHLGYAVLIQRPKFDVTYEGLPLEVRPIANPIPPLAVALAWPKTIHQHRRVMAFAAFGAKLFRNAYDDTGGPLDDAV